MQLRCKDFNIGDRVQVEHRVETMNGSFIPSGSTGTVRYVSDYEVSIEWDEYIGGHSLGGTHACKYGYGWNFFSPDWDDPSIELLHIISNEREFFEETNDMEDFFNNLK